MATGMELAARESVGRKIARARSRRGVSQEDFSSLIGLPLDRLQRIEEEREAPDCPVLMRVVLLAGVAEDELLAGTGSREDDLLRFSREMSVLHGTLSRPGSVCH